MTNFQPPEAVASILSDRYFQEGENWEGLCRRVAHAAAQTEPEELRKEWEEKFFNLMFEGRGLANTPALINLGVNRKGCVAACFSFRPEDNMESIMEVGRLAAMTLKFGGGVGYELSLLRPEGAPVQSTHKQAMGPIGVLKYYNAIGDMVTQAGIRKAALIGILRVDHPDIIKFCRAKEEDKTLANFNISVSVPDGFMKKLTNTPEKPHICRFEGTQYHILPDGEPILKAQRGSKKVLSVRDVYSVICDGASLNGDPGVFFVDQANRNNPLIDGPSDTKNKFYIGGTNPCLRGDQKVYVADGRGLVPIRELAEVGKDVPVFCLDNKGNTLIRMMRRPHKTAQNVNVVKVSFDGGGQIYCTPNHKIYLFDGSTKQACDLSNGDCVRHIRLRSNENSNSLCFTTFAEVKQTTAEYINFKVTSVKEQGTKDVYNGTVDDFHNYLVLATEQRTQTGKGIYDLVSVGNCGEIGLSDKECCILGSIDLAKFVVDGELDTAGLSTAFRTITRMLEDMIDVSAWPDKRIEEKVQQTRRIGVGVMGFSSLLDKLGIRYGSEECMKIIDVVGTLRETSCSEESKQLAEERGTYPAAPKKEKHRHVARTTQPPTGTLAMIANTSWGIEPHLYWAFEERRNDEVRIRYLPAVEEFIKPSVLEDLIDTANGNLVHLNDLIQAHLPSNMILAKDLTPEDHLAVVTAWQKYIDNSVSKTICASADVLTPDKVGEIYRAAWENKLKGITVYPEGSREGEPMSIGRKKKRNGKSLPQSLKSDRHEFQVELGGKMKKTFCFVGLDPKDCSQPVEVFLKHPHVQDIQAIQFIDLTTRLLSLALRYRHCSECGEEVIPLGKVIKQLRETDGQSMFSVPSIFVKALAGYLPSGEPVGNCPTPGCDGELTLIDSCERCLSCHYQSCA